jgi:hypothetical protein
VIGGHVAVTGTNRGRRAVHVAFAPSLRRSQSVAEENGVVIDPGFSYLHGKPSGRDEHRRTSQQTGGHRERGHRERRVDR